MATPSKTSPDYDPVNEALDVGYGIGRSEERKRRTQHVERARRGGKRAGAAQAKRDAEEDRRRRAQKTREANAQLRARRAARTEEQTAATRRGAYRAGVADAKRQADARRRAQQDAQRQARGTQSSATAAPGLRAPNPNLPLVGGLSMNPDRTSSARIIMACVAMSAIAVVIRDTRGQPAGQTFVQSGGTNVQVPAHLRSLGGVFIAGTIALIVNEAQPGIGLAAGLVLLFDVGGSVLMSGTTKNGVRTPSLLEQLLGGGLFAKTVTTPYGQVPPGTHTGSDWYAPGNPGNPNGVKVPRGATVDPPPAYQPPSSAQR